MDGELVAVAYIYHMFIRTFRTSYSQYIVYEVNHVEIYVVNYSWLHICSHIL